MKRYLVPNTVPYLAFITLQPLSSGTWTGWTSNLPAPKNRPIQNAYPRYRHKWLCSPAFASRRKLALAEESSMKGALEEFRDPVSRIIGLIGDPSKGEATIVPLGASGSSRGLLSRMLLSTL